VLANAMTALLLLGGAMATAEQTVRLESRWVAVGVQTGSGRWWLRDRRSGVRWPTAGEASAGVAAAFRGGFRQADRADGNTVRLTTAGGASVTFALVEGGRALEIRYAGDRLGDVRVLADAVGVTDTEGGFVVVPCREGLLIPAEGGKPFRRTFGTSEYEGCHMNMLGFVKAGSAMAVTWSDAYVSAEVRSARERGEGEKKTAKPQAAKTGAGTSAAPRGQPPFSQRVSASLVLRASARAARIWVLGKGDWNTVAAGYRAIAERKKLAVTLREKIRRNADAERMIGAANVKLWTCLARRMNEQSTKEESVNVRWTFAEAAQIAEHLHKDLGLRRCLFMIGGWTEGGYDCRHPDNLPANPECGGNRALAATIQRIQKLGFVGSLHDNYQDMYRDAKSWDPNCIEKHADGKLVTGGRWLGGRAYMVCAPKQLEMARRPQNLPGIRELFPAQSYFIDTTYAVGPRVCHDPAHRIGRNDDIAWKIKLSDYAREVFGLFGSECGREWALPHSDFFEGLVGVSGRYYHQLDAASLGATVIPFWEMVYHDCQICWGKYGYSAGAAGEYVAHHVLCARPLHYHSIGEHLYWKQPPERRGGRVDARVRVTGIDPTGARSFRIGYEWLVREAPRADWRVFVHFVTGKEIRFQDDHAATPPVKSWRAGQTVKIGPHDVAVPPTLRARSVDVYVGLFDPKNIGGRAALPGCDRERRVLVGKLHLKPALRFEPAPPAGARPAGPDLACHTRSDHGWAAGLHPIDVFLKNTQEVLGPLHAATAHQRLTKLEFVTADRSVRRATYGRGKEAVKVIVNFGRADTEVTAAPGGRAVLPPFGFIVAAPRFAAFHAKRWGGRSYDAGAMFTLKALDDKPLAGSARVRIFHAFGDPTIRWQGADHRVERERIIVPGR